MATSDLASWALSEPALPDYNIYRFTDALYKIIRFTSTAPRLGVYSTEKKHYDKKLDSSISRSRRLVLEYALCNSWTYFCTFTLSPDKFDRSDLAGWHKQFKQWIRDQRKKYPNLKFDYLLVPEQHKDGSWHMHGLFSDISPILISFDELSAAGRVLPLKLLNNNFYNWPAYEKKYGFCSFGLIRNAVGVSYYISKYIDKQLSSSCIPVGLDLYYHSQGLNRAEFHGDIYGRCSYLDSFLTHHYDFCSTGMTQVKDGLTWNFAFEFMDLLPFDTPDYSLDDSDPDVDLYFEAVQEVIEGFV